MKTKAPHPAEESANSDLVRLVQEFEGLEKQIAEIDRHTENEQELVEEALRVYRKSQERYANVVQMNNATRRVRLVQLDNVRNLLNNRLGNFPNGCCIETPVNRIVP